MNKGYVMYCLDDLSIVPRTVTGSLRVGLRLARRLSTPRGTYRGHKNFGIDTLERIQETASRADLQRARAEILAEVMKDADVRTAHVEATFDPKTKKTSMKVRAFGPHGTATVAIEAADEGLKFTLS